MPRPGLSHQLDRDKFAKVVQINHTRLDPFILVHYCSEMNQKKRILLVIVDLDNFRKYVSI